MCKIVYVKLKMLSNVRWSSQIYKKFSHTKSSTRISKNVLTTVRTQCHGRPGIVTVPVKHLSSRPTFSVMQIIIQIIYPHVTADRKNVGDTKSAQTRIKLMVLLVKKLATSWPRLVHAQAGFQIYSHLVFSQFDVRPWPARIENYEISSTGEWLWFALDATLSPTESTKSTKCWCWFQSSSKIQQRRLGEFQSKIMY